MHQRRRITVILAKYLNLQLQCLDRIPVVIYRITAVKFHAVVLKVPLAANVIWKRSHKGSSD